MLGTEERDEFYAVGVSEDVNRAAPLRIHARLVGDQADALAAQRRKILFFEDVDAGLRVFDGVGRRS